MSALEQTAYEEPDELSIPQVVFDRIDKHRGTTAMRLVIATEAMLFVVLFFGYFFLSQDDPRWLREQPPKLKLAFIMLAVLLTSSLVLWLGEKASKAARFVLARLAIAGTVFLGAVFLTLQFSEYKDHLKELTPQMSAYGSMFYLITTIHGMHVASGMLMLLYVLCLPKLEPEETMPFRPLHNVGMYWHFVDTVWIFIIALLYVLPNLR